MSFHRSFFLFLIALLVLSFWHPPTPAAAHGGDPLAGDGRHAPRPHAALASADDPSPGLSQPSAFMAGRVAVQVIFVESDGSAEPSTENWTPEQIAATQQQIAAALNWWRARLPNARLSFDLRSQLVASHYEPIKHDLSAEGQWIGDALARMGYQGSSYFDQAYAADEALRQTRRANWATTIFVANSAADDDGRFADDLFAYAYINGPFLVITSDGGPYSASQLAPVVAHEMGHIFGALDQYASAMTLCSQQSGYLAVPTTNSQTNNCGTYFMSIMLDLTASYPAGAVDDSALGQIGYRDSDGDGLPDPLDTTPTIQMTIEQPAGGGRPIAAGRVVDQPYPSPFELPTTINSISRVEYRVDGEGWIALPPADGAYNSAGEEVTATLPLYDGQHTIELRAINSVGAASPIVRRQVAVSGIGAAPAYQVSAPALSNSTNILINFTAPTGSSVQISEDPFFAGAVWTPTTASAAWRLNPTDGAHVLYVRFRDSAGLESAPFARSIALDRTAPTGRALVHSGDVPWLELEAHDNVSGVAAVQISDDEAAPGAWQPFRASMPAPSGASDIQVRFRDQAGNVSAPIAAQSIHLTYLPLLSRSSWVFDSETIHGR